MEKIKNAFLRILSVVTILGSVVILVGLIIFFLLHPQLFGNLKNIIGFLVETFLLGGVVSYIGKRVRKEVEESDNISNGILNFMAKEPLILSVIFIFVLAQIVVFSYILPVHRLNIEIRDSENNLVNANLIHKVVLSVDEKEIELSKKSQFSTSRFLSYQDSVELDIEVKGFTPVKTFVPFTGFMFYKLFSGENICLSLTPAGPLMIMIKKVEPLTATIHVISPIDFTFQGAGFFEVAPRSTVRLKITDNCYIPKDTTFIAEEDITLEFELKREPGKIRIRAFNEGGEEITVMNIFVDGKLIPQKSGEIIQLSWGAHQIRIEKRFSNNEKAVVKEFPIIINSCDLREITKTAEIE